MPGLHVRIRNQQDIALEFCYTDTVLNIKRKICDKTGINIQEMILVKNQRQLNDDNMTIKEFDRDVCCEFSVELITYAEILKLEEKKTIENHALSQLLHRRIIGQNDAISTVVRVLRRKELRWYDNEHPLVLLFLGPPDLGKTELVKGIADYLHKEHNDRFVYMDMSEFSDVNNVKKFIGCSYYNGESQLLTNALMKCPSAVVLFDGIEMAHNDVITTIMRLFDKGHLTLNNGEIVECKQAIFIMTTDLGSEQICEYVEKETNENDCGTFSEEFKEKTIMPILKKHFNRDKLFGQIEEIVYFMPLKQNDVKNLVTTQLNKWKQIAIEKHKITLKWSDSVVDKLAEAYNPRLGNSSILRELKRKVVDKLIEAQEQKLIKENSVVDLLVGKETQEILLSVRNDPIVGIAVTGDNGSAGSISSPESEGADVDTAGRRGGYLRGRYPGRRGRGFIRMGTARGRTVRFLQ